MKYAYTGLPYSKLNGPEKQLLRNEVGECQICGNTSTPLQVDHDHDNDVVRAIVCGSCNLRLGWVNSFTLEWLEKAAPFIDEIEGAKKRARLFEIVESHYIQRNAEYLKELQELEARRIALINDVDKVSGRLASIKARFSCTHLARDERGFYP